MFKWAFKQTKLRNKSNFQSFQLSEDVKRKVFLWNELLLVVCCSGEGCVCIWAELGLGGGTLPRRGVLLGSGCGPS